MEMHTYVPTWVELTQTEGDALAHLMVQQLQEIGIPAHKWQEGAGGAFGLTVGPLGITHVMVPDDRYMEAREFLALDDMDVAFEPYDEWDEADVAKADDVFTRVSRAMLALVAVILSPIGVVITYLMKFWSQHVDAVESEGDSADTPAIDDA